MLAKALRAGNTNPYSEDASIAVPMNFCPLYDGQYNQPTTSQPTGRLLGNGGINLVTG